MKKFLTIVLASTLQLGLFAGSGWQVRCFKNENSPYTQCKAVKVVPGGGGVNVLNNPKNSGRQNANNHYATKSNQTTVNSAYIPYREDADTVRADISGVARDLMKDLDGYCRSEEASFPIYRKRDANGNLKYYPKTGKTFHSRDSVPMNYPGTDENGGELVAIVHNHPVDKNGVSLSVGDVMAAINMNVRVYAGGCKQGISPDNRGLVYVDSENGYIYSVSGTDDIGLSFRKSGPDEVCPVGGFDFKKSVIVGDDVCIPIRDNFKIPENITDKDFEDKFARMAYHPNYFKEMSRYAEARKLRKKQSGENVKLASAGNASELGTPSQDLDENKTVSTDEMNTKEKSGEVGMTSKMPDLTKLIDLMKQAIEELRKMLAIGRRISDEEWDAYNKLITKISGEHYALGKNVTSQNFTLAEHERFSLLFIEKVKPYCEQIESLTRQIEAKGLGRFGKRIGLPQMPFGKQREHENSKTK